MKRRRAWWNKNIQLPLWWCLRSTWTGQSRYCCALGRRRRKPTDLQTYAQEPPCRDPGLERFCASWLTFRGDCLNTEADNSHRDREHSGTLPKSLHVEQRRDLHEPKMSEREDDGIEPTLLLTSLDFYWLAWLRASTVPTAQFPWPWCQFRSTMSCRAADEHTTVVVLGGITELPEMSSPMLSSRK